MGYTRKYGTVPTYLQYTKVVQTHPRYFLQHASTFSYQLTCKDATILSNVKQLG